MKDENIPLRFYFFIARQIGFEQLRPLFIGYVNGRSVHDFTDGEMLELLGNPRVIILDEPTVGLDKGKAVSVKRSVAEA